jgi:hypothetical protein
MMRKVFLFSALLLCLTFSRDLGLERDMQSTNPKPKPNVSAEELTVQKQNEEKRKKELLKLFYTREQTDAIIGNLRFSIKTIFIIISTVTVL